MDEIVDSLLDQPMGDCLNIILLPILTEAWMPTHVKSFDSILWCLANLAAAIVVADLKDMIKKENQVAFQHVDADALDLWKVSIPSPTKLSP
ncbi:hypothetical protein BJV78DRAFT_1363950 [Lactifluus subvellereus]|nr:hypothetical protein BJV78DRAFT_1363950 [Lactifluus subvellereus]